MIDNTRPTEILQGEHLDVLRKLDALEKVFETLSNGKSVPAELKALVSFFNADFWTHFDKEEKALFPELEKFLPRDAGPVGVMLAEHDDLRQTNTKMQGALATYFENSDKLEGCVGAERYGAHLVGVLREHIEKEDSILFMMADEHLDRAQDAKVIKAFSRNRSRFEKNQAVTAPGCQHLDNLDDVGARWN